MKYIITIMILAMSVTSQAQDVVRLPLRVAKQVQVDLIAKDSCETMLNIANDEIYLLNKNIASKETVIDSLKTTCINLNKQVENEKNMKITYKAMAEECKTAYDTLKMKDSGYRKLTKMIGFLGTAVITGLTAVILFVK